MYICGWWKAPFWKQVQITENLFYAFHLEYTLVPFLFTFTNLWTQAYQSFIKLLDQSNCFIWHT